MVVWYVKHKNISFQPKSKSNPIFKIYLMLCLISLLYCSKIQRAFQSDEPILSQSQFIISSLNKDRSFRKYFRQILYLQGNCSQKICINECYLFRKEKNNLQRKLPNLHSKYFQTHISVFPACLRCKT